MNTDTPTRKTHIRGTAAAIVAAAREARGLHQSSDVPHNYRVGREIVGRGELSGYGVAYPPKFAAAHMPYATTTRMLKRGFVILTETEAAEIALEHVSEHGRGREAAAERLASTVARCDQWAAENPAEADRYAEHKASARAHHAETIAKLDKAQARYSKLVAKARGEAEEATLAEVQAAAPELAQVAEEAAEAATAARYQDGIVAAQLQARARIADTLEANAAAARQAQQLLETTIVAAAELGLSDRAIAKAAGITHPTVAKIRKAAAVAAR
jgi:hypothetical protein